MDNSSCTVNNCCFCIDLRVGCLIIGYLRLIADLLLIICLIVDPDGVFEKLGVSVEKSVYSEFYTYFVVLTSLALVLSLMGTFILLYGVHKDNRKFVRSFVCFVIVQIIMQVLNIISKASQLSNRLQSVILTLLSIVVQLYILLVTGSYYMKMKEPQERRPAIYSLA